MSTTTAKPARVTDLYSRVVGQARVKDRLQNMVRSGRIPHALMFTGSEGYGTLAMAAAFAQHMLCETGQAGMPCGECAHCRKVGELVHPDVHYTFPVALSKKVRCSDDLIAEFREAFLENSYLPLNGWFNFISAENKQPLIPAEEAASIIRKLSYTSFSGRYRVMIIWYPEKMNTECANKLLKILEEPSENTVFVLVCAQPNQLLPTILSRVQQIPFAQCSESEISNALIEQYGIHRTLAQETAVMAGGSFGEALELSDPESDHGGALHAEFQTFMRTALKFDPNKVLPWVESFAAQGRETHKQFFQYGLAVFRDCLMHNYGSRSLVKLSGEERTFLEKFAPFVNQNNYAALVEEFNSNYYFIERNANPKILFLDLLWRTFELLNTKK